VTILNRRQFNLLSVASATAVPLLATAADDQFSAWATEQVLGELALRAPNTTGTITGHDRDLLKTLFMYIGSRWEMNDLVNGEQEFAALVDTKTTLLPSYLSEYQEAASILERARSELLSIRDAVSMVLVHYDNVNSFATTRLGRLQKYVSSEFMTWWVSRGGFRRFGYSNYKGFMRGPFTDHLNLPFRGLN
jgi:hypothetical protein